MHRITRMVLAGAMMISAARMAQAQTETEFTYQGQLQSGGQAVDAEADFRFRLFDASVGGTQVGDEFATDGITIVDGLFDVALDFGADALSGLRWLEIDVRSPAGVGAFSTLDPRQKISGSPFSVRTRGVFVNAAGDRVGIGTSNPSSSLDVAGGIRARGGPPGALGVNNNGFAFSGVDGDNDSGMFSRLDGRVSFYVDGEERFHVENNGAVMNGTMFAADFEGRLDSRFLRGTIQESRLPQNSIDSSEIEDNSLTGDDLRGPFNSGHGSKPFHFQKYGPFNGGGTLNTGMQADLFVATVAGFRTFDGDILENGTVDPIQCYPFQQNGTWHVRFDVASHNNHEGWEIWMMFVDRRMTTVTGF